MSALSQEQQSDSVNQAGLKNAIKAFASTDSVEQPENEQAESVEAVESELEESEDIESDDESEDEDGALVEDDEEEESEDSEEEQPEDEDDSEPFALADDSQITIDGETYSGEDIKNWKLGSMRQEDYTRKTQAVKEVQNRAETSEKQALAMLDALNDNLAQSVKQLDSQTNWDELKASDPAEYQNRAARRAELQKGIDGIKQAADEMIKGVTQRQSEIKKAEAKEAVSYLKAHVDGWNNDLYSKVGEFAVSRGMPREAFDDLTNPYVVEAFTELMRMKDLQKTVPKKKAKPVTTKKRRAKAKSNPKAAQEKGLLQGLKSGDRNAQRAILKNFV